MAPVPLSHALILAIGLQYSLDSIPQTLLTYMLIKLELAPLLFRPALVAHDAIYPQRKVGIVTPPHL